MNNWLKKLKKKAILPAAAFLAAAAAIGTTFAWQQWDLSVTNNLSSHTVIVTDKEVFTPEDGTKIVKFGNTGNGSVFLRVSYSEYWIKGEESFEEDKDIKHKEPQWPGTSILSNIVNGEEMAVKYWSDTWPDSAAEEEKLWYKAPDGWYYYKKVLPAGEESETILDRVGFPASMPDEYADANYRLFFKAEVVQCSDGANTLNSEEVNKNATQELFGRKAKVEANGTVIWEGEGGWNE